MNKNFNHPFANFLRAIDLTNVDMNSNWGRTFVQQWWERIEYYQEYFLQNDILCDTLRENLKGKGGCDEKGSGCST